MVKRDCQHNVLYRGLPVHNLYQHIQRADLLLDYKYINAGRYYLAKLIYEKEVNGKKMAQEYIGSAWVAHDAMRKCTPFIGSLHHRKKGRVNKA